MPGDLGRLRCGTLFPLSPLDVLEAVGYGGKGGRILWDGVSGGSCSHPRRYAIPHHIQCGGGCGGEALDDGDDRGHIGVGRAWTGG